MGKEESIRNFRLVFQQNGRLGFEGDGQLQEGSKGDVDHPFLDLCDLAVVDAESIGHFAKAESLFFSELSKVFAKPFQYLFISWCYHYRNLNVGLRWKVFSRPLWSNWAARNRFNNSFIHELFESAIP